MTVKISELPLTGAYALTDYIPIVDSNGLITNRVRMSTLVTGSFGLSASYYSAGAGTPSTTGLLRVPYVADQTYTIIGTKASNAVDRSIIRSGLDQTKFGDTSGTTILDGQTVYIYNAGNLQTTFDGSTVTTTKPVIATELTASYGVNIPTGSLNFSGSNSTNGLIRLNYVPTEIQIITAKRDTTTASYPIIKQDDSTIMFGNEGGNFNTTFAGYVSIFKSNALTFIYSYSQLRLTFDNEAATFTCPITASNGLWVGGNTTVTLANSGSTVAAYDRYLKGTEDRATMLTTPGSPSKAMYNFISGALGKTYLVDVIVTAQSTTTTGSLAAKYTGHYYMTSGFPPSNIIGVVDSPYTILESTNHTHLTASLTSSAGNIIVSGTQGASAETFRWGCFVRVQEQGA